MKAVVVMFDAHHKVCEIIIENVTLWDAKGNVLYFRTDQKTLIYPTRRIISSKIIHE